MDNSKNLFKNESQPNDKKVIDQLTADELTYLLRYLNPQVFETNQVIDYLNTHENVKKEIFTLFLTPSAKKRMGLTYLSKFGEVKRDQFLKRIPIYFYDVNIKEEFSPTMTELFDGFCKFKTKLTPIVDFDSGEYMYPNNFDFEELYRILEEIIYVYGFALDKVFDYIIRQCGTIKDFEIFNYWYKYLKLIEYKKGDNINPFPRNILFSYNTELVNRNKPYVIFRPALIPDIEGEEKIALYREENSIVIGGLFPIDEDGNPVYEWIGIWAEGYITRENRVPESPFTEEDIPRPISARLRPALKTTIAYELGPKTRIFVAIKEVRGKDEFFGNEKVDEYWQDGYIAPSLMKLDCTYLERVRIEREISLKKASDDTGINLRTYQRIETGEVTPDALNIFRIMNYFGISSYENLIKREIIKDLKFEKFKGGKSLSDYLDKTSDDLKSEEQKQEIENKD